MSVWLPVKMCSCDRQVTYLVWNHISSLIIRIIHLKCIVSLGYVSKGAEAPDYSPHSEFAMTPVPSRPEDAITVNC